MANHPFKSKVIRHFKKAKSIKCLNKNIVIDVSSVSDFQYNAEQNIWSSIGGAVVFWTAVTGYAPIIEKKKCKCLNCKCKEKKI